MSFTLIRSRSESRSRLRSSSRKPFFRRGRSLDSNLSVRRCEVLSCNSADNVKEPERTIRRYKYVELDEKEPQEPDHCEDYSEDDYQIQVSSNRGRWVKEASLSLVPPKRRRDFEALLLAPPRKLRCSLQGSPRKPEVCIPHIQVEDYNFKKTVLRPYNMSLRNPPNSYNQGFGYDSDEDYPPCTPPRVIEITPRKPFGINPYNYRYGRDDGEKSPLCPPRMPRTPRTSTTIEVHRRTSVSRNKCNAYRYDGYCEDDMMPMYRPRTVKISPCRFM